MPVVYQSSTTRGATGGFSASGLAKPTGTAIGDVLVAQILAHTDSASGALSIASTGDTWTLVQNNVNTTPVVDVEFYVWICVVANASSTITISWDGDAVAYGCSIHRFTGVDPSAPQDVTATKATGTSTSESSAGLASGTANRHFVLCTGNQNQSARSGWSSPLVERVDAGYVGMASGTDAAGTDTGAKSNTINSDSWCAVLLALKELFLAQATPGITLSLAPSGRALALTQTTPSIRLSMQAFAHAIAQASPSITLSLAPTARLIAVATATPSIRLTLAAASGSEAAPRITLALAPRAIQVNMASSAPAIRLALEVHAIGSYVLAGSSVIELEYNAVGSTLTGSQQITFDESGVSTLTLRMRE